MRLRLDLRDLVLVSWTTDAGSVRSVLPPGLAPVAVHDEHLVTLAAFRVVGGRLGRWPVPPFSQVNARVYTELDGEPAVYFALARVTLAGLPGALLRAPYRLAHLRVRRGRAHARGLGVSLRYELGGRGAGPGPLGRHELGLFESDGLRGLRIRRGPAEWRTASLTEPPRAEILVALGFELRDEPTLLYTERTGFEADVPPRVVAPTE